VAGLGPSSSESENLSSLLDVQGFVEFEGRTLQVHAELRSQMAVALEPSPTRYGFAVPRSRAQVATGPEDCEHRARIRLSEPFAAE
jgi:hypothetical protein